MISPSSSQLPNKRKRPGSPLENDLNSEIGNGNVHGFWPAWLLVEGIDEKKPLSALNAFAVDKGFKVIAGELSSIKRLRNGSFLVHCSSKKQSDSLLKATLFVDRGIKVYPHKQLNTTKGVIRCRELTGTSETEIKNELSSQGVIDVKRVTIKKGQDRVETNTLFLTFCTPILPQSIKIGYLNVKVEMYIPSPMRCFKCQKFGHTRDRCSGEEVCGTCSMQVHNGPCQNPAKCVNCEGAHSSSSKHCPVWLTETEIQKVKTVKKIPFFEARKLVAGETSAKTKLNGLFSDVLKMKVKMISVGTQTLSEVSKPKNTLQVKNSSLGTGSKSATSSSSVQTSSGQKERNALGEGVIVAPNRSTSPPTEGSSSTCKGKASSPCKGKTSSPCKEKVYSPSKGKASSPSKEKTSPKRDPPGAGNRRPSGAQGVMVVEMTPKAKPASPPKPKKKPLFQLSDRISKAENRYQFLSDGDLEEEDDYDMK